MKPHFRIEKMSEQSSFDTYIYFKLYIGVFGVTALDKLDKNIKDNCLKFNTDFFPFPLHLINEDDIYSRFYAFITESGEVCISFKYISWLSQQKFNEILQDTLKNAFAGVEDWLENGQGHPLNPFEQSEMNRLLFEFWTRRSTNDIAVFSTLEKIRKLLKNCEN